MSAETAILRQFDAATAALRSVTFKAWKLGENESYPATLHAPEDFGEAVDQALALMSWNAKDVLAVLRIDAGRKQQTLRLYAVKRSTKRYAYRAAYDGGKPVRVGALEAVLISEAAVESFKPVEPFDAFRDNAAGRDLTLVSQ